MKIKKHECKGLKENNDNGRIIINKHKGFNWHIECEIELKMAYYDITNINYCPWCGEELK